VTGRRRIAALAAGTAAAALVLLNTAALVRTLDYGELGMFRRLWADLARGVAGYVESAHPLRAERAARATVVPNPLVHTRSVIVAKVAQHDIRPWQFWRTIRPEPFLRERLPPPSPDPFDDPGRGLVLAAAFRLRGGIAPFLVVWLGPLLLAALAPWIAHEAFRGGAAVAGIAFLALLGLSPFVLETAAFTRSAAGFYVVALVAIVPLALYGLLGPAPTARGLAARWAAGGFVFGVCALCRSGVALMLPALLVLLAASLAPIDRGRRPTAAAACLALLLAPYALMAQPERHDVWAGVWEGLGDFDREKGHAWSDPVAEDVVRRAGASGLRTAEGMAVLKREVFAHVREDPGWYAGILGRRLAATVSQHRLWPTVRADGLWMRRGTSANEGFIDKYYAYTTTVDFLGFGNDRQVELPIAVLVLPTLALFGWAAVDRGLRAPAAAVAVLMAAALPLPVLITTAGAVEPQAFALAYGLGAAFLADALARRARTRIGKTGRINGTPGAPSAPRMGDR
jgi:hypothetical protein